MATQLSVRPQWENSYERSFQLRKNLEDSRKAFLNFSEEKEGGSKEEKRAPAKKISFKIKKTSSLYRRKEKISVNTVQELAKKYNELVEKSEQPNKMRVVVKKDVVVRKPSLKKRPSDTLVIRKSSVKREVSRKKEISKLEMEGGVKAAIAIFEERIKTPQPSPKPAVPEKTFNAKDLATRNQEKRLRIYEKRLRSFNNNNNEKEKSDTDFFVQVVNIPLSPPKKCDSKHETMHLKKTNSFTKESRSNTQSRLEEARAMLKTNSAEIQERLENIADYRLKGTQKRLEEKQRSLRSKQVDGGRIAEDRIEDRERYGRLKKVNEKRITEERLEDSERNRRLKKVGERIIAEDRLEDSEGNMRLKKVDERKISEDRLEDSERNMRLKKADEKMITEDRLEGRKGNVRLKKMDEQTIAEDRLKERLGFNSEDQRRLKSNQTNISERTEGDFNNKQKDVILHRLKSAEENRGERQKTVAQNQLKERLGNNNYDNQLRKVQRQFNSEEINQKSGDSSRIITNRLKEAQKINTDRLKEAQKYDSNNFSHNSDNTSRDQLMKAQKYNSDKFSRDEVQEDFAVNISQDQLKKAQGDFPDKVSQDQLKKAQGDFPDRASLDQLKKAQGDYPDKVSLDQLKKAQGDYPDKVSQDQLKKAQGDYPDKVSQDQLKKAQEEFRNKLSEDQLKKTQGDFPGKVSKEQLKEAQGDVAKAQNVSSENQEISRDNSSNDRLKVVETTNLKASRSNQSNSIYGGVEAVNNIEVNGNVAQAERTQAKRKLQRSRKIDEDSFEDLKEFDSRKCEEISEERENNSKFHGDSNPDIDEMSESDQEISKSTCNMRVSDSSMKMNEDSNMKWNEECENIKMNMKVDYEDAKYRRKEDCEDVIIKTKMDYEDERLRRKEDCEDARFKTKMDYEDERLRRKENCEDAKFKTKMDYEDVRLRRKEDCEDANLRRKEDCEDVRLRRKEDCEDANLRRKEDCEDAKFKTKMDYEDVRLRRKENCEDAKLRRKENCVDANLTRKEDCEDVKFKTKMDYEDVRLRRKENCEDAKLRRKEGCENANLRRKEDCEDAHLRRKEDYEDARLKSIVDCEDVKLKTKIDCEETKLKTRQDHESKTKVDCEDSKMKIYEDSAKNGSKKSSLKAEGKKGKVENAKDPRKLIAKIIGKGRSEKKSEKRKLSDAKFYDLETSKDSENNGSGYNEDLNETNNDLSNLSVSNKNSVGVNQDFVEANDLIKKNENGKNGEIYYSTQNGGELSEKLKESTDSSHNNKESSVNKAETKENQNVAHSVQKTEETKNLKQDYKHLNETTDLNRKSDSSNPNLNQSEEKMFKSCAISFKKNILDNNIEQQNDEELCPDDYQNTKEGRRISVENSNNKNTIRVENPNNKERIHVENLDDKKIIHVENLINKKVTRVETPNNEIIRVENQNNLEIIRVQDQNNSECESNCVEHKEGSKISIRNDSLNIQGINTKSKYLLNAKASVEEKQDSGKGTQKMELVKKFEELQQNKKKINIASTIQARVKQLESVDMTKNTYGKNGDFKKVLEGKKSLVSDRKGILCKNNEIIDGLSKINEKLDGNIVGNKNIKELIEAKLKNNLESRVNSEIKSKIYGESELGNNLVEIKNTKEFKINLDSKLGADSEIKSRIYGESEVRNNSVVKKNEKLITNKNIDNKVQNNLIRNENLYEVQDNDGNEKLKQNLIKNKTIEELEELMLRKANLKIAPNDYGRNNSKVEYSIYETLNENKRIDYEKLVLMKKSADYEKCLIHEKSPGIEILDDYEECEEVYEKCKTYSRIAETNCNCEKSADCSECTSKQKSDWEDLYDFVDVNIKPSPTTEQPPEIPPRRIKEEKIYEELIHATHDYEDDGYEICESPSIPYPEENIYETLPATKQPPTLPRRKEEPLPPRPPSRNSFTTQENESNFYESIYSKKEEDAESTYESIYGCRIELDQWKSKRDSLISEQQSNSIYNRSITSWAEGVFDYTGKNGSEISGSDRSDDWVDMSDNEEGVKNSGFIILKERQKVGKRVSGWSQQMRDQWNKIPRNPNLDQGDSDSDHHYETLSALNNPISTDIQDDEFDSFDSDSESDNSFAKNDSGVDMGNTQLPEPPNQQTYVHRLAATAGKHMKKWRNWSLTKNDITKTLGRMTKRKSRTDLDGIDKIVEEKPAPLSLPPDYDPSSDYQEAKLSPQSNPYQNVQFTSQDSQNESNPNAKSLGRKGFLNKFRRSMSISGDTPELSLNNGDSKAKSTFYLTETIDVDKREEEKELDVPVVNLTIKNKTSPTRPRVPPPPAPKQNSPDLEIRKKGNTKRSTSWYSECGVFKNAEPPPILPRRPNTFWYAEVGLYRSTNSTPSTSSTENSGSLTNVIIKPIQEDNDDYYNVKNENDYYNGSIQSSDSYDTKKDEAFNSLPGDLQLRLQDEPLYQFYDAAVLESVCKDGTSDFEYDGYEQVGKKNSSEVRLSTRPSAMELVSPKRNNVSVARTLWCEIPEVIQSTVLSTLNIHQKKLQEAKFEMLTSEASYLNSLNVLADHFIKTFETSDFLNQDEKDILFGKVNPVKECSEKLLNELEKCWQDNILLHGICDIVKKHAEENFYVYVSYCENQIFLDRTLRKLKERPGFVETLKQLESSTVCHLLTLHSFLMLPMQRVTRWPLLLDAVLKRLSHQDEEYLSCQYALATLNKIVNQCNEGARRMERVTEMQKIASQLEFGKGVTPISLVTGSRWLVRSGPLIQMQARGDDIKLTFGKRFTKVPLHLFLFNDILIVAKSRGDDTYIIQHYCYRSYLEINSETLSCLPFKDTQGRHLIFLTILENHEEKTIELLLSCNSETDKERWLEALSPPKSENPDETLYECWDCPQVTAIHTYTANQPDELALSRGDIINVTRKMADGWFHGERIRDGETGWFPANYTVEVANPHVRARNLKQRYRLLAFSESYLKSK